MYYQYLYYTLNIEMTKTNHIHANTELQDDIDQYKVYDEAIEQFGFKANEILEMYFK